MITIWQQFRESRLTSYLSALVILLVVVVAAAAMARRIGGPLADRLASKGAPTLTAGDPHKRLETPVKSPTDPRIEEQKNRLMGLRLERYRERADALSRDVDVCVKWWRAIERRFHEIQSDERGRRIATKPNLVAAYAALSDRVPDDQDLREAASAAVAFRTHVELVNDELEARLEEQRRAAEEAHTAMRAFEDALNAILAESEVLAAGAVTLADALSAFRGQQARERLEFVKREAASERAQQLKVDAALEQQRIRDETERMRRVAQEERLRRHAADPSVIKMYRPFTDKGYVPLGASPGRTRFTIPQPASYANLRKQGILNNHVAFWKTATGSRVHRSPLRQDQDEYGYNGQGEYNDRRTLSGWPQNDADWRKVKNYFTSFKQLAPYWIESGVLRP